MSEIGSERVLTTKTVACSKAALLNENESRHFQFVLLNRNLKYSEYCKQADAISLYAISHILHQGIAVLHSKGTWTSIMSGDINHCSLLQVYVSNDPKTQGNFFPIEPIPLDDPFHPDHPDNNKPTKGKAVGTASKRIHRKCSSLKSTPDPSLVSMQRKDIPDKTPIKSDKKKPAQEPSLDSEPSKDFATTLCEPV